MMVILIGFDRSKCEIDCMASCWLIFFSDSLDFRGKRQLDNFEYCEMFFHGGGVSTAGGGGVTVLHFGTVEAVFKKLRRGVSLVQDTQSGGPVTGKRRQVQGIEDRTEHIVVRTGLGTDAHFFSSCAHVDHITNAHASAQGHVDHSDRCAP